MGNQTRKLYYPEDLPKIERAVELILRGDVKDKKAFERIDKEFLENKQKQLLIFDNKVKK